MRQSVRAIIINGDKLAVMHRNKFGHEYYTLVGGGIDIGESHEQALVREVNEEASLRVTSARLVVVENHDRFAGPQYVYLCQYIGENIQLRPDTDEASINELGKNIYTPMWLPFDQLPVIEFVTPKLQKVLIENIPKGFSERPIAL